VLLKSSASVDCSFVMSFACNVRSNSSRIDVFAAL